jgi:hypothetical protein
MATSQNSFSKAATLVLKISGRDILKGVLEAVELDQTSHLSSLDCIGRA